MENDCREAFEKWFHPVGGKGLERDRQGYYTFMVARNAWNAWQAAWSARASSAPEWQEIEKEIDNVLYDCFHNFTVPSMQGKTMGDLKNYTANHIKNAIRHYFTPPAARPEERGE